MAQAPAKKKPTTGSRPTTRKTATTQAASKKATTKKAAAKKVVTNRKTAKKKTTKKTASPNSSGPLDLSQVMNQLKKLGREQTRKIYHRHGAQNIFGVSVADMKSIAKKIKGQQDLAGELYETGNGDAMYLAGMVADGAQMTKRQLDRWAKLADWYMISEYTVPWVAVESEHGRDMAIKWIKSKKESIASSGWATYAGLVSNRPDGELDLKEIKSLLKTVENQIHDAPNRVRYAMNGFVIAVGCYVRPLVKDAKSTAGKIGKVQVDMGGTSCKVPCAPDYIAKVESAGRVGKKRSNIKC